MAADIELKRGSVRPIEARLQDGNGDPIDLSGSPAPTIKFQMRTQAGNVLKINGIATIADVATAHVRYTPTTEDTDTPGDYWAEWRVSYGPGSDVIVPEFHYLTVTIWDDLA